MKDLRDFEYLNDLPTESLVYVKESMLLECHKRFNLLLTGINEDGISDENIDNLMYYLKGLNRIIEGYNAVIKKRELDEKQDN